MIDDDDDDPAPHPLLLLSQAYRILYCVAMTATTRQRRRRTTTRSAQLVARRRSIIKKRHDNNNNGAAAGGCSSEVLLHKNNTNYVHLFNNNRLTDRCDSISLQLMDDPARRNQPRRNYAVAEGGSGLARDDEAPLESRRDQSSQAARPPSAAKGRPSAPP